MQLNFKFLLLASVFAFNVGAVNAQGLNLGLDSFQRETGLTANTAKIQQTWNDLKSMGTTDFLGGTLGSFKLDESSMIAGALTLGTTEFDKFLRQGIVDSAITNLGSILSKNMGVGAGFDLSKITGSFTANGGSLSNTPASPNFLSGTQASSDGGLCAPEIAQKLVENGNKYVDDMVSLASSEDYGFSNMQGASKGSGFAGMSCLDKLFQNAGSDILFKPPSLGSMTAQLQNWSCDKAMPIAEQIAGAFGDGIQTTQQGGFFPDLSIGDAQDSNPLARAGASVSDIFGKEFAKFTHMTKNEIAEKTSISKLFKN